MRVMMVIASAAQLLHQRRHRESEICRMPTKMNFEAPLTSLVWLTSVVSVVLTYVLSYLMIP